MQAIYTNAAQTLVSVTLAAGEVLNGESGPAIWQLGPEASVAFIAQAAKAGTPIAPFSSPSVAAVTIVYRSDLFRRCTDDEADKIDAALDQTSTRMRNLFASVQVFRSDAPEWQLLHDTAVSLFGADRAAVLLASST